VVHQAQKRRAEKGRIAQRAILVEPV